MPRFFGDRERWLSAALSRRRGRPQRALQHDTSRLELRGVPAASAIVADAAGDAIGGLQCRSRVAWLAAQAGDRPRTVTCHGACPRGRASPWRLPWAAVPPRTRRSSRGPGRATGVASSLRKGASCGRNTATTPYRKGRRTRCSVRHGWTIARRSIGCGGGRGRTSAGPGRPARRSWPGGGRPSPGWPTGTWQPDADADVALALLVAAAMWPSVRARVSPAGRGRCSRDLLEHAGRDRRARRRWCSCRALGPISAARAAGSSSTLRISLPHRFAHSIVPPAMRAGWRSWTALTRCSKPPARVAGVDAGAGLDSLVVA